MLNISADSLPRNKSLHRCLTLYYTVISVLLADVYCNVKHRSRDVYCAINVRSEAEDVYGHKLRSEAG